MALALRKRETQTAQVSSRLLPMLLGEKALAQTDHLRVLDFGRANRCSLGFFSGLSCRLQVLDASDSLIAGTKNMQTAGGDETAPDVTADAFDALFPEVAGQRFDLILLWDIINLIPARALPAFFDFLAHHAEDGFRGHGFMLHKRNVVSELRHLGLIDAATLALADTEPVSLFLHTRKYVNECMAPLAIDHGVLHGDGRAEFLFQKPGAGGERAAAYRAK